METFINKDTVRKLRLDKSWSQEKLAEAARMNLRTVQRIEKDGMASLRSCESLASALGIESQEKELTLRLTHCRCNRGFLSIGLSRRCRYWQWF